MYIHKILQPERIINLKKKSNGVIFDSKFRIFLLKSHFTESFRESNQQIEKKMNIIPEETIAVWARERRVLCKIFFISPLILMSRETKIRPTEHQSSTT